MLNKAKYKKGKKIVNFLTNGAPSYQKSKLPSVFCKNVRSTLDHGAQLTDTVADWVKKGFVAGPFDSPPLQCRTIQSKPPHGKGGKKQSETGTKRFIPTWKIN